MKNTKHLGFANVDFLFVYVRVISWIVLISRPANDHEAPRNEIRKMSNEKWKMLPSYQPPTAV